LLVSSKLFSQIAINQFSGTQVEQFYNEKSLSSSKNMLNVNIFYKENYEEKCDKSNILKSTQKCNCKDFKTKLEILTSNISRQNNILFNIYSVEDSYFNFKGKKVPLNHLTAIITTENEKVLYILSKFKSEDYIKSRDKENKIPNKIFDFENKYETSDNSIILDDNWFGLYTIKSENKGGMCPVYDIPKEDLFLNYLTLILGELNDISIQKESSDTATYNKIIAKIDSLNTNINNKIFDIIQKLDSINPPSNQNLKFSFNLGFSILNAQKIGTSQGFYSNQLSSASMPLSYAADFQYWIKDFRVGLGYAYSRYQFNNSLADNNYSTDWNSAMLNNSGQLNIYASNLKESFSFEQNNLNLIGGYSKRFLAGKQKKNQLGFDIDLGLGYVLPFTLRSRLTDATINYRGQLNGIEDELMNIAELGLIENDRSAIAKESALRMQGISINTGANFVYEYNNFSFKLGLGYHFNRYSNKSYNENQRLTSFSGDYKSSLYSNKQLSTQFNTFQFSIGYTIK
jgi:hypothetical protein